MIKKAAKTGWVPKLWTNVVLSVALVQAPLFILAMFLYAQEVRNDYLDTVGWQSQTLSQQLQKRAADLSGYSPEMQRTLGLNIDCQSLLNDNIAEEMVHIGIIGPDGKTIASTDSWRLGEIEFEDEVKNIFIEPAPFTFIASSSYETLIPVYNAAHPSPVAVIYIGFSQQAVDLKIANTIKYASALYFAFLLLSSFLISILLRRFVTQPIAELSSAATSLANGKLSTPIPQASSYEVRLLNDSFSNMSKSIAGTLDSIKESENRFRDFAEASSDWFWEADENLKFTYASDRFFELTGFNPKDIYGQTHRMLVNNQLEDIESKKWQDHFSQLKNREPFRNFHFGLMNRVNEVIYISLNGNPLINAKGAFIGYRGTGTDITERKKLDAKILNLASHDALTGLISRYEFEQLVTRLLSNLSDERFEHAMCFLDLDQFKVINDTCGHAAGDELLRQLGRTLRGTIRKRDTLARLGGDEFGVMMEDCTLEQAHRVADDILKEVMNYQFSWEGNVFRIGVSIGLVAITETSGNFTDLLKQADSACYLAKDRGRNRIHTYHPDDIELAVRHGEMQWVGRINRALDENQFCLYAQPIVSLNGGGRRHYELLVRMLDESGDIIPPGAFLPAAERYNLIEQLDAWVVSHACTSLAAHPAFIDQIDFVTINLSGSSLTNQGFLESIIQIFKEAGISPEKVCFEVTETVAISNLNSAIAFIRDLKEIGCQFALDDFGSGISSFGYLKTLPVDYLKIDGMFIKDIVEDPIDRAMVKSINEIGSVMGMKTIAEFVENDKIKMMLQAIGVDYGQGYGLGKPEPFIDLISRADVA